MGLTHKEQVDECVHSLAALMCAVYCGDMLMYVNGDKELMRRRNERVKLITEFAWKEAQNVSQFGEVWDPQGDAEEDL